MELPLSIEDTVTMHILQEAQAAKVKPVFSFFALRGEKTDKGYSFEADSKKEFFLVRAVGSRATRLTQVVESLQGVPQASRDVLEQYAFQGRYYENELGAQTPWKLLSDLTATTDVQKLNEHPTVWTANWVEVGWPVGDNLLKKDGSELFFQTSLRDLSGQVINVWMNEKALCRFQGLLTKRNFLKVFRKAISYFQLCRQ